MGDDDGSISDILGEIGSGVVGELKKFGKSATGQITGSASASSQVVGKAPKVNSIPASGDSPSILGGLKKFAGAAAGQVTGHEPVYSGNQLSAMAKKDNQFSQVESAKIKAKINQIYGEYAANRAREQRQQEMVEQRQEEAQKVQEEQVKKQEADSPTIAKTRAEIKNYGAE